MDKSKREAINAARRQRYAEDPRYRAAVAAAHHEAYLRHRDERLAYVKRWKKANPEKTAVSRAAYHQRARENGKYRAGHIRRRYGLTPEQEARLFANQSGCCAICRVTLSGPGQTGTHLDHDHATKRVRGFLCLPCNQGLGRFRDDPTLLTAAIAYLRERPGI